MFITAQDNAGKIIFLHFARLEEFLHYNKNHPITFGTSLHASLSFCFFLFFSIYYFAYNCIFIFNSEIQRRLECQAEVFRC